MLSKDEAQQKGIYEISHTSKPNHYYIGSTTNRFIARLYSHKSRLRNNKHSSKYLQNVINKYGLDGLVMRVIEVCSGMDRITIRELEQYYIELYIYASMVEKEYSTLPRQHVHQRMIQKLLKE